MQYLKLKSLLKNEGDKIKVQVIGKKPEVEKTFNNVTKQFLPLEVIVEGQTYTWETSKDQQKKIKDAGCGATFYIVAYKSSSGYIGFSYLPEGDVSLNVLETKTVNPKKEMDDTQERILRGMCFNAAYTFLAFKGEDPGGLLPVAQDLHAECSEWLRSGEEKKDNVDPVSNEEVPPPPSSEDFIGDTDLPF